MRRRSVPEVIAKVGWCNSYTTPELPEHVRSEVIIDCLIRSLSLQKRAVLMVRERERERERADELEQEEERETDGETVCQCRASGRQCGVLLSSSSNSTATRSSAEVMCSEQQRTVK